MVARETNPRRPVAGITFPHKRCRWRVEEDARSRRSRSLDVVDIVVHLTIMRSCTRRHNRRRPHARSHVRLVVDSSTPSVQRGSGRRDPPDTPTHFSKCVKLELTIRQSFAKPRWILGQQLCGREEEPMVCETWRRGGGEGG
jgi:hypothetical protein